MTIENQESLGSVDANGVMRFRFSPKDAKTYSYTIHGNLPTLEGKAGALTSFRPPPDAAQHPAMWLPHWWTDDPSPAAAEGPHLGARRVSQWREDFLHSFAARLDRCRPPRSGGSGDRR